MGKRIQNIMFENIDVSPLTRETSVWMKWEGTTETFFFAPLDNFLRLGLFSRVTVSSIALCTLPLLECTMSTNAARGRLDIFIAARMHVII